MNGRITIEISSRWERRINSPLFRIVSVLTGVSITFAPLFVYWAGQGRFGAMTWYFLPLCFAAIYLVPLFYIRLASEVITAVRARHDRAKDVG